MASKGGGSTKRPPQSKITKTIPGPKTGIKVSPSLYLASMKRTTEEALGMTTEVYPPKIIQLLDMSSTSHHKESNVSLDQALFQPSPSEVRFQQFQQHKTYEFPLKFRNLDSVAHNLRVTGEKSPYFSITCQRPVGMKIAPGMEVTYNIIFTPEQKKDYEHELVCITEREKFVVPVKAIGVRALLDYPDEISFSAAPVKYCSTKTILMRNVGNAEAKFTLEASPPYSVTPPTAALAVNACMQATVSFNPKQVGEHSGELLLSYDSGERVYTKLYGSAIDINVGLDKDSVTAESTYMGLSSHRLVVLYNRSDVVVQFHWKAFSTETDEEIQREIVHEQLKKEEKLSMDGFYQRCMHNPAIKDRLPILSRTLDLNRKKYSDEEDFLYFDECLIIEPQEGEIWPNSQAEITVIFRPDAATTFTRMAYCDVTGKEARLELKMKGDGVGPKCIFSFDTLDIQNVFVNSAHAYEVCLENKGDIEASYSLIPSTSLFGPNFTFDPSNGTLQPRKLQAIQISFCSQELGEFSEEFVWKLEGAPEPLKLRIMGVVIGPTYQFDVSRIKFGTVPCGFATTMEVTLSNTSEIPMTFHFRVADGNNQSSESHTPSPAEGSDNEFTIVPQDGTLPPSFQQVIKVVFIPQQVKSYSTMIIMGLRETGTDVFSLPITAKAVVPRITLLTPLLNYGRCFLDHPCTREAEILNDSDLPVKYTVQDQTGDAGLTYSTPNPSGIIHPHSTLNLPLVIQPRVQGEMSVHVPISIANSTAPSHSVELSCIGEGPVVCVTPNNLQWGVCPVLTSISKVIMLTNQSVIPAEFECAPAQGRSVFSVVPRSAVVLPEQSLALTVTAFLDDCLKFSDKLNILIKRGVNFTVFLRAQGQGSTVVSSPPLHPRINLGTFFSRTPCQRQFELTNMGRRMQALSWVTEGFSAAKVKKVEMERKSLDMQDIKIKQRYNKLQIMEAPKKRLFRIVPEKFVLEPQESCLVTLEGCCEEAVEVHERMTCYAIIGKNPTKERIMSVDITAAFICPLLQFTAEEVVFEVHQMPGTMLVYHTQQLGVKNVSQLAMTAVFSCPYPFCLMDDDIAYAQRELTLESSEEAELTILYDSTYCRDKVSRCEEQQLTVEYTKHPQKDHIPLRANIRFPNLVFDKREIDFGCILNDTEVMCPGRMTNNSPLPVRYAWFFIRRPPVVRQDPELLDEGVDMESDHETTEEEEITEITEEEDSGEEEGDSQGSSKEELASVGSGLEEKEGEEGGEGKREGGEKTVEGEVRMEEEKGKEVEVEQREGNGKWEEDGSERKEVKVSKKKGGKRRKGGKGEVEKKQDEARKEEEGKGTVDDKINEQMKGRKGSDVTDADLAAMSNQVSVVISGEGDDIIEVIGPHFPVPKKSDFSSKGGDGEDDGHDIHVKINSKAALIGGDEVGSEHGSHQHGKVSSTGIPTSDAQTQLSGGSDSSSSNKRKRKRKKKRKKAPWELAFDPFKPIPISQVFDILPIHGVLEPGASSFIHYNFYGHSDITADVVAACKVEGGPTYEIQLRGEASRMYYKFSQKTIEFGAVPYDHVQQTEIVLYNRGKVAFEFFTVDVKEDASAISPGGVVVTPSEGCLLALDSVTFSIAFLPGVPEQFSKSFKIQVAHFETDIITLVGDAVFPQLTLNLPRVVGKVEPGIHDLARANLALPPLVAASPAVSQASLEEPAVEMEIDRLLVKEFAAEHVELFRSHPKHKPRLNLPEFYQDFGYVVYGAMIPIRTLSLANNGHTPISFTFPRSTLEESGFAVDLMEKVQCLPPGERLDFNVTFDPTTIKRMEGEVVKDLHFNLSAGPQYTVRLRAHVTRPTLTMSSTHLDFSTVTCGQCKIITVRLSNIHTVKCEWTAKVEQPIKPIPHHIPQHVRKKMKHKPPPQYFEVEPSAGCLTPGETQDIRVRFMPSEEIEYSETVPVKIRKNPDFNQSLTMVGRGSEPRIVLGQTCLEFDSVLPFSAGSVAEVTVTNPDPFPVEFYSLEFDKDYSAEEEILGSLKNFYDHKGRLFLPPFKPGEGLPERLHKGFSKEQEVREQEVKDREAREQEAREQEAREQEAREQEAREQEAREQEVKEQEVKEMDVKEQEAKIKQADPNASHPSFISSISIEPAEGEPSVADIQVGEEKDPLDDSSRRITQDTGIVLPKQLDLKNSPLASSFVETLAEYMGIDLSPEAKEAEGRLGVAVVIHGPFNSGKTTQAKALAAVYGSAVLQLDAVVIEAISLASTVAGQKARELCIQALSAKSVDSDTTATAPPPPMTKKQTQVAVKEHPPPEFPPVPAVPMIPFLVEAHEDKEYAVSGGTLIPTQLPEDILVEIFSERLQHEDCHKGIMVDGVESQFCSSPVVSTAVILRALNNRKHIYFVNLSMDLQIIKNRLDDIEQQKILKLREEDRRKKEAENRERERIENLLNIDEDEYEKLTEEGRAEVDAICLQHKRDQRERRRQAKEERERQERERKEEEERLKEINEKKKKGKGKQLQKAGQAPPPKPQITSMQPSRPESVSSGIFPQVSHALSGFAGTSSKVSVVSNMDSPTAGAMTPRHKPFRRKASGKTSNLVDSEEDVVKLERLYGQYKSGMEGLKTLLEDWDRQKGVARPKKPPEPEEAPKPTPTRKSRGFKQKEMDVPAATPETEESREGLGVPFIDIQAGPQTIAEVSEQILSSADLPTPEEILLGMGIGPKGPPIPGSFTFQIFPLSLKRKSQEPPSDVYSFIVSSPDDPNGPPKEPIMKAPTELELEVVHEKKPPSARGGKRGSNQRPDTGEGNRKPGQKKKPGSRAGASPQAAATSTLATMPEDVMEDKEPNELAKLTKFRWVIPAFGETKLKLLFKSEEAGQYDLTLNFELIGTRRRYQLFCRGLCTVPSICREPRIVFPSRKKTMAKDEIVRKRFILDANVNTYHFGPLHCGKDRDRYKDGRYPENMESLTISNTSIMDAEVSFFFHKDHNGTTYLLDPSSMKLESGQSGTLNIWAYPKSTGKFEDTLLCCVKHNPDPISFKICCHGAEPDLKVDKKLLEFKKVLLHRKQTNVLHLHNKTLLPVAWKLGGLEQLGEDFSFSQTHGIVQPLTDFPLSVHFRSVKPVNYTKKAFKIEVSDVEQIMGLMHVETVQITAEAYDVAIDVSFPRSTDGSLDFGCVKACDEQKIVIQIKNKGKYDVAYNFLIDDNVGPESVKMSKMFHVQPSSSALYPSDKAQTVAITFRADKEVELKDLSVLRCQVVDIHLGEQGELIANIPIRISAKAVFSRFSICPIDDINFGCMIINNRKQTCFTIQNRGDFEFKYAINKQMSVEQIKVRTVNLAAAAAKNRVKSRERVASPRLGGGGAEKGGGDRGGLRVHSKKVDGPVRTEVLSGTQKLVLGMFCINPAFGSILPGQFQLIMVDCVADRAGKCEEFLSIEISDRPKSSPPIKYKICGDVMIPGIETTDLCSIFEEHRVSRELGVLGQHLFHGENCVGVYGEEEKRFVFKSVIVGKMSRARFKITNPNKIQCDVLISIKPMTTMKTKGPVSANDLAFDVEPSSKIAIMAHSSIYATVTFHPMAIQSYSAYFEAVPDSAKGKPLQFELYGEGNLPQVSVMRPTLRNSKGQTCLLFQRLSLQNHQVLPVTLKNTGTIQATVVLEVTHGRNVFEMMSNPDDSLSADSSEGDISPPPPQGPITLELDVGESCDCLVKFAPQMVRKYKCELWVTIKDNMFEKFPINLVGEGYEDDIIIDNIRGQVETAGAAEMEEVPDDVEAYRATDIQFGTLAVGESRQIMFRLANLSETNTIKFQWPTTVPSLVFMPSVGHIRPKTSKTITISFKSTKPQALKAQRVAGKMWKISFQKPLSEVPDWDDRMKSVQWVGVPQPPAPTGLENASINSIAATSSSGSKPAPTNAPLKRKVVETEREPAHQVVDDSHREMELSVSGVADYCKYECPIHDIRFKETLIYQTRSYAFPLRNTGKIELHYNWMILSHDSRPSSGTETSSGEVKDDPTMPFSVSPMSGTILPDRETDITVRFSPLRVMASRNLLHCFMSHLDNSFSLLALPVEGKSLMPMCHFDLECSDYLTERGGGHTLENTAEIADARVLEFPPCGLGLVATRKFDIINPTSTAYDFVWSTESNALSKPFSCLTQRGSVEPGTKYQMVFEYRPNSLEVVESVWKFSIPSLKLSQSFLLVGYTLDPNVFFDRTFVSYQTLLIGTSAKEKVYLVNTENTEYPFSIVEQSLCSDSHSGQLKVKPMSGVIPPNSKIPLEISFKATQEKDYSFQLKCKVKRKTTPLILKVNAEGYSINLGITYTGPDGVETEFSVGKTDQRVVNFGQIPVNSSTLGQISVFNHSLYSFEYCWSLSCPGRYAEVVSVEPLAGEVVAGSKASSQLNFKPNRKTTLHHCQLILDVPNGPKLPITLKGSAVEPSVNFSFEEYNFGPCLLHRADMPPQRKTLAITNTETGEMSVHCLSKSLPHLGVQFEPCLLARGESVKAVLEFKPCEPIEYVEKIVFEINGFFEKVVTVRGVGSQMKIELANPAQKIVNFGTLHIGERGTGEKGAARCSRSVKLVNRSLTPLSPSLSIVPSSSVPALQQDGVLTIEPSGEIPLKANGGMSKVIVSFKPTCRVPQFTEEVTLECQGSSQLLFVVTGACHGLEISLDTEYIPFGAVVHGTSSTRKLLLMNTGDIGAAFSWKGADFGPHFSIFPKEGYISPGIHVALDVTFHPQEIAQDLRKNKLSCVVEGCKKPLKLTLCGTCIEKTPFKEVLHFTATVRCKELRNLTIHNKTHSPWVLHPVINGEQWSGSETLTIEPNHYRHYELTYHPLRMTTEQNKDHGSIFFPQPDGTGLFYHLMGTAEPPKPVANILQDKIPCKKPHTEPLSVENWLRRPQRFTVIIDHTRPEKLDRSVSLHGLNYIDVPALSKRDYQLQFYSFKECNITSRVTFKNEETGEYLFYNVTFKPTPPGIIDTITLTSQVRKSVSHVISIANPLPNPVTMTASSNVPDITLPCNFIIGAQSDGKCMFEYLPLKVGQVTGKVTLQSSDLGVYHYEVHLAANPCPQEKPVHFTTCLGSSQQHTCRFISFSRGRTEYTCRVTSADFVVDKSITVAPPGIGGTEVGIDVTFEPSHLGDTNAMLVIISNNGGEYSFPLYGHCLPPKPQGPFVIKPGHTINIPFKNVFSTSAQFKFSIDNPVFTVRPADTIKQGKTCNIAITYDAKQAGEGGVVKVGKLTVTNVLGKGKKGQGEVTWVYYLRGALSPDQPNSGKH